MLSAVITALLLVVMLLIITSLILGARREYRRRKQALAAQSELSSHPPDAHVTAILYLQDGQIVSVAQPKPLPSISLPASWYTRRRTLVSLGFILMIVLTLFVQDGLAGGTLKNIAGNVGLSILSIAQTKNVSPPAHPAPLTASQRLVRVDSAAHNQYYTDYQWQVWAYSSCSGIAMEEVMNAYGRHLIASDVLQEELNLGVWNVQLGLLREQGIAMTAAYYGFNASLSHARTIQDIVALANKGTPVIVSVRDAYYFPGGHIFVVRAGDSQYVYTADSSPHNFTRMSYAMFQGMWTGFSAVLTPQA